MMGRLLSNASKRRRVGEPCIEEASPTGGVPSQRLTSVLPDEHDGEHAGGDAGVGGIGRGEAPRAIEAIDLEEHPLARGFQRAEVALAVGIVVGLEPVEGGDGVEDDLLALAAERDNAGGEDQRAAAE